MTKEQAIEVLRCNTNLGYGIVIENESTQVVEKALQRAIKALEQQPGEDCISRAEVQKFVSYIQSIKDSHNEQDTPINYGTICDLVIRGWKLMDLPPVTPIRKAPREDITEDEVRINMLELALNQAKEHADSIEVLTDNHKLIFKAEKRGNKVGWSSLENVREKVERGNSDSSN